MAGDSNGMIGRRRTGPLAAAVEETLADLAGRDAITRLHDRDHTLWSEDPTEIVDRLGWLDVAPEIRADGERLDALRRDLLAEGCDHVLVMGMGGSSLFPEVLAGSHAATGGGLHLSVLDSTDPEAVGRALATSPAERTLFVASSKSGTTIETRSHLDFFWEQVGRPDRFVAITDPGSDLAELGAERGFREVFENRPDIGGRYSALSYFGLVPAALADPGWRSLVDAAIDLAPALRETSPDHNPALLLGAVLGAAVRERRDKVTLLLDPRIATFGLWLEQLLAESTGKAGVGVVPVVGESIGPLDVYGPDRLFVAIGDVDHPVGLDVLADAGHPVLHLGFHDPADLGAQVLLWEAATAICGAVLDINPFDQPNVAEAKAATTAVLEGETPPPTTASDDLDDVLATIRPGDYLGIQAYLDPGSPELERIEEARLSLRDRHRVATTLGIGPRFLHSTGQLHKGGPPTGVYLQILDAGPTDLDIPGRPFTFGQLIQAQADGDLATLRAHGLRVVRTTLDALEARTATDPPTL